MHALSSSRLLNGNWKPDLSDVRYLGDGKTGEIPSGCAAVSREQSLMQVNDGMESHRVGKSQRIMVIVYEPIPITIAHLVYNH